MVYTMNREKDISRIIEYMKQHKNELRTTEAYCNILGLDNPRSIKASLCLWYRKHGILKVTKSAEGNGDKSKNFYGISDECGSRECFYRWCDGYMPRLDEYACPLGNPNKKLKFIEDYK